VPRVGVKRCHAPYVRQLRVLVSPEMQTRIRSLGNVQDPRPLTVTDTLVCAIAEAWDDAYRSLPLWATQGIRHQQQEVVWN
jgi:hypothetical protein